MISDFSKPKPQAAKWAFIIFCFLAFYFFGFILASYTITYPRFDYVHDHWQEFMTIYNLKIWMFLKIPSILLIFSSISLWVYKINSFPKWVLLVLFGLTVVTTSISFLIILPIFETMQTVGFNSETNSKLLFFSRWFQIIPTSLICLLILFLLNDYLKIVKVATRWIFILVLLLTFYLIGTNTVEALIEYRLWNTVSETDWLAYRKSGPSFGLFVSVYLLPGWLPILLIIPMIWLRPKGIPRFLPICFLLLEIWAAYITVIYFIPNLQIPLDKIYSKTMLQDLIRNDNLKRVWVMYALAALMILMYGRIKKDELQENN